ncbi:MAG: translocation/assembly module TamB [Prevotella sp.]|nr:translocation/assembly module TamB [Prevotella sp.]
MVHLPFVQTWLGKETGDALQKKLGTDVSVGNINVGFLNRIIVDNVLIYDQQSKEMIRASRVAAKIDYIELLRKGQLYISSAQLFGFSGNFYRKDTITNANYQFLLDSLASKDNTKKSSLKLNINSLIIRHGSLKYDRQDIPFTASQFNLNHIDVKDISVHLSVPYYTPDSLNVALRRLSLREESGLELKHLAFNMTVNNEYASISDFKLQLPNTDINIPAIHAYYRILDDGKLDKQSLTYDCTLSESKITLSDVGCFIPALKPVSIPIYIETTVSGGLNTTHIEALNLNYSDKNIELIATGNLYDLDTDIKWDADIKRLACNIPDISEIAKTIKGKDYNIPTVLTRLGNVCYKGNIAGDRLPTSVNGQILTDVGNATIRYSQNSKGIINADIETGCLDIGKLLDNNHFGQLATDIKLNCRNNNNKFADINIDGVLSKFDYNNYSYQNIVVKGKYDNNIFDGLLSLDDPNGQVSINGKICTEKTAKSSDVMVTVRKLNPSALKLTDKWKDTLFDFDIMANAQMQGEKITDITGNVILNDFFMISGDSLYHLDRLHIEAEKEHISMQSDFGHAELSGKYDLSNIAESFKSLAHSKLPSICPEAEEADNKFSVNAEITDSEWLGMLFNIPLEIKSPLRIKGEVNDSLHQVDLRCESRHFLYDGSQYRNLLLIANTLNDTLSVNGNLRKIMSNGQKLDLSVLLDAADDKLLTTVSWNNNRRKAINGYLDTETSFVKNDDGKHDIHVKVKPSELMVNDTLWKVKPASIDYNGGDLIVNHFAIEHNRQHIRISGMATKNLSDSIEVDLQDVDVNYVLNLVNFHTVEFEGYASGKAFIKSVFYEPEMYADLIIRQFKFQHGRLGELFASVKWNKEEKQIDIDAHADDEGRQTVINGYVSPSNSYIDLNIEAINTNIEFLGSFCGSFMSDIDACANGKVEISGPLKNINMTGKIVADGKINITPLNTTFTLKNDTIIFVPDTITFAADTIRDRNGNIGIVTGALHHQHLTNLSYDINIGCENMLCYNTNGFSGDTFYGTVYGTGNCSIRGGSGRIDMDIDITPEKNSYIEYNAASPDAISDQQFITWNDITPKAETDSTDIEDDEIYVSETSKKDDYWSNIPSDMRINFIININPDATLRVLMDQTTNDYIALNGTGSIKATYFNKGSFDMFGTYLIDHGIYKLTIQNIIKKVFNFQSGGTIVFTGDPYNAALNLQAIYTVNSVPLSDLSIGNSFSSNNVRVDCIMNIGGTPLAPHVDFDLDLPTVSSDAEQMVRTVINGEEEMNQQVVYLLSIGRFYVQGGNNSDVQQNQTSLAMQSLLSGTISQQINSLLGSLVKNNNWSFGANISAGTEGFYNAEYEGLLSGHLLNNRLIINGQFGYRDNANATTSFIGDFDINYSLLPSGSLALKVYNQSNDRYFTKSSLNTQGIGIIMKKDFNQFKDMFILSRKKKTSEK